MSDSSTDTEDLIDGGDPTAGTGAQTDGSATSSPQQEDGGESLIDSVQEALKAGSKQEESLPSGTGSADPAAPTKEAAAEDPLGELTDEEMKRYGPKTQRRIRQLLGARTELTSQIEDLTPKAKAFDTIDQYIKTNGLTNEDVAVLLEIGALVRNDPFKAHERFSAITAELSKVTGHTLPPDLAERVRLGYVSEQDAREIVQARNKAALAERRVAETTERSQAEQQRQRVSGLVQMSRSTANEWESRHRATDPDWGMKQGRISELIRLAVYENGYPEHPEKVVQMLDGFLKQVNEEFARFKPPPREVRPVTGSAARTANSSAPPKSFMEVVERALAQ